MVKPMSHHISRIGCTPLRFVSIDGLSVWLLAAGSLAVQVQLLSIFVAFGVIANHLADKENCNAYNIF